MQNKIERKVFMVLPRCFHCLLLACAGALRGWEMAAGQLVTVLGFTTCWLLPEYLRRGTNLPAAPEIV